MLFLNKLTCPGQKVKSSRAGVANTSTTYAATHIYIVGTKAPYSTVSGLNLLKNQTGTVR